MKFGGALEAGSHQGTWMVIPYLSGEPPELVPALAVETPINEVVQLRCFSWTGPCPVIPRCLPQGSPESWLGKA